jgi:8-oxo-dGTP pyrophosphatase MutT (NUDIX family)
MLQGKLQLAAGELMATGLTHIRQAAAIPIKAGQVCLVTSTSGKRWVIPKGCLEPGKTANEIALQEAWEEAGLVGMLEREPVGSYLYEKLGNTYHVLVFILRVTEVADIWPEASWRQRVWLKPTQALTRLGEVGLQAILRGALSRERLEVG